MSTATGGDRFTDLFIGMHCVDGLVVVYNSDPSI